MAVSTRGAYFGFHPTEGLINFSVPYHTRPTFAAELTATYTHLHSAWIRMGPSWARQEAGVFDEAIINFPFGDEDVFSNHRWQIRQGGTYETALAWMAKGTDTRFVFTLKGGPTPRYAREDKNLDGTSPGYGKWGHWGYPSIAKAHLFGFYARAVAAVYLPMGVRHFEILNEPQNGAEVWMYPRANITWYRALYEHARDAIHYVAKGGDPAYDGHDYTSGARTFPGAKYGQYKASDPKGDVFVIIGGGANVATKSLVKDGISRMSIDTPTWVRGVLGEVNGSGGITKTGMDNIGLQTSSPTTNAFRAKVDGIAVHPYSGKNSPRNVPGSPGGANYALMDARRVGRSMNSAMSHGLPATCTMFGTECGAGWREININNKADGEAKQQQYWQELLDMWIDTNTKTVDHTNVSDPLNRGLGTVTAENMPARTGLLWQELKQPRDSTVDDTDHFQDLMTYAFCTTDWTGDGDTAHQHPVYNHAKVYLKPSGSVDPDTTGRVGTRDKSTVVGFGDVPPQTLSQVGGDTPEALLLWTAGAIEPGSAGIRSSTLATIGVSDGTTDGSVSSSSLDNTGTPTARRQVSSNVGYIRRYDDNARWIADLSAFGANSFTLDHLYNADQGTSPPSAAATLLHYLTLPAADITNAKVVHWTGPTAMGNFDVTTVGFQPDVVIHLWAGPFTSALAASETDGSVGIGVADSGARQWSVTAFTEHKTSAASSNTSRTYSTAGSVNVIDETGILLFGAHDSMLANGFRTNFTVAGAGTAYKIVTLAIKGPSFYAAGFTKATGAAPATQNVTGPAFVPYALLLASNGHTGTGVQDGGQFLLGASSGPIQSATVTRHAAMAVNDADGQATTQVLAMDSTDRCAVGLSTTSTIDYAGTVTAMLSNGATFQWDPNNASAVRFGVLFIGPPSATVEARTYAGGIFPQGDFTALGTYVRSFAGGITPTGNFTTGATFNRSYAGGITPSGVFTGVKDVGVPTRTYAGGITPSGTFTGYKNVPAVKGEIRTSFRKRHAVSVAVMRRGEVDVKLLHRRHIKTTFLRGSDIVAVDQTWDVGDLLTFEAQFTRDGALRDPTTVILRYGPAGSVPTEVSWPPDGVIVKDSTGIFHADISLTSAGRWYMYYKSLGDPQAAASRYVDVQSAI